MDSPKTLYDKYKNITDIEKIAYERLFENYLKLDIKESKKLIDIESTDQESILKSKNGGLPFEGMIYTFIHLNNENLAVLKNLTTNRDVVFHDFTPILFCSSVDRSKHIIKGLNLNILPKSERLKFLQVFYESYKDFFEDVEKQLFHMDDIAINEEYRLTALAGKNPQLFLYFSRKQHALFNYAFRSYELKNIRKLRMLEFEEWKYIPFFEAKESFKRINMQLIYQIYWDNLNKTI
jgi:hypothetical protein